MENISDAVLIFSSNGRLKNYNKAYINLWQIDEENFVGEPLLSDVIDLQKSFFADKENWEQIKRYIKDRILANAYETVRNDGIELYTKCINLPDDSVMIIYKRK